LILDTNAISAVADRVSSAVEIFKSSEHIALPVVVLGEYRYGIMRSRHRAVYEHWLEWLADRVAVLDVDRDTSQHYAQLRLELRAAGRPLPANDIWIAALSRQHRLPIMSSDRHFDHVRGLTRISW
jgi:predicted nucleic acid-binding protein